MKIVTDCAADMPAGELNSLEITQAPLSIHFPDGVVNSADLTSDQFYDRLDAMYPDIPTTSLPSSGAFEEIDRKLASASHQILSIHLTSGLSGTVQAAQLSSAHIQ
jgi:fatty acid-binding protein DegV